MRNKFYINLFIIHINLFINPDYGPLTTTTIGLVNDMYCVCKQIKQFKNIHFIITHNISHYDSQRHESFISLFYNSYESDFINIHLICTQMQQSNEWEQLIMIVIIW